MRAGAPVKRLGAIVESVAAVLLAVVVVIVLVQVFGRYILRISLSWPEELARYVLVWLMFFGVAAAAATRSQIVVDTLLELVSPARPPRAGRDRRAGRSGGGRAPGVDEPAVLFGPASRSTSPATGIPSFWIYLAIPVGGVLLGLFALGGSGPAPARRACPARCPGGRRRFASRRPAPALPDRSWRASFRSWAAVFLVLIFAGVPVGLLDDPDGRGSLLRAQPRTVGRP